MRPSYATGFARYAADSKYPELWRNLVGAWCPFLGNTGPDLLRDMSGRHNPGTLTNGPTWGSGKYGPALSFDGVNDLIDCGDSQLWDDISTEGTISIRFKTNVLPGAVNYNYPISRRDQATNIWTMLLHGDVSGKLYFDAPGGTLADLIWDTVPTIGVWYHVVVTWNSSAGYMYIDGQEVDSVAGGTVGTGTVKLCIGNRIGGGREWDGFLDNVSIWNRALSKAEIALLYREPYAIFEYADIPYAYVAAVGAVHAGKLVLSRRLKSKVGGGLV